MTARLAGYSEIGLLEFLGLLALCACGGCWEKIEYAGPDPAAMNRSESQPPAATVATAEQPATPTRDADDAAIPTETPSGDAAASDGSPTEEPPASVAPPATEATAVVGSRYDAPSKVEVPPVENATVANQNSPQEQAETAAAVTATVAPQAANTRRAAWELGSKLSIVALANDRGVTEHVPTWAREASAAAKVLGVQLAKLPDRPDVSDGSELASKQVLNYLFVQGQELGRTLAKRYGPDHTALFEVAVKSNLLLLIYQPGSSTADTISGAISQAAPRARLPAELWQPLLDLLKKQAPLADVRAAVRRFHADVDSYLAKPVER